MSMDVADLFIKVDTTDLNRGKDALGGFAKAGNAAEDQTKKLNAANILAQSSLGRYAAAFANPTTAALAFAAAMLAVGVKSVQAAEEARLSIVKLDLIYRNSGKSIGITLKELERNIQSLAASSRFDDEDIRAGAIEFVKFGNIAKGVLESIMKTSVQYAAFTGTNVVQAASAMARAMADPEAASRLLKNAGVALTNTEQKYIATLMESGRMMEAQAIVARKLADTYAGTEKELRGLGSTHSQVMKEIGEAFEALGATAPFQFISEASLSGLKMARNIVMDITAALAGEDTTNRFFGRLHPATKGMQDSIDAAAKASAPAGGEFAGGVLPSEAKMKSEIAAAEASKKTLENYEKTVTASRDYIAALKLETEQVGLNAVQKKLMSDAIEAAKAPTAALRMEIMKGAQALAESTVAAEAAATATKLLSDSVTGLADVGYKQVSSLQQQVDAQNQANAQIGMSQDQVMALVGAKELEDAANLRTAAQYAGPLHNAYIQYADDLEKAAGLQKELASGKQIAASAAASAAEYSRIGSTIESTGRFAFISFAANGMKAMDSIKQSFKMMMAEITYQLAKKYVLNMVMGGGGAGMSGMASAASATDSLFSAANMMSTGSTLISGLSGGLASSLGGTISGIGTAIGSTAASAFGAGMAGAGSAAFSAVGGAGTAFIGGAGTAIGGSGMGATASMGASMGAMLGPAVAVAAVAALLYFGFKVNRTKLESGIKGEFGVDGFEGENYSDWRKKSLFMGKKFWQTTEPMEAKLEAKMSDAMALLRSSTKEYATVLSLPVDTIAGYTKKIKLALTGDADKDKAAIDGMFLGIADELANLTGNFEKFILDGETSATTLKRLATEYASIDAVLKSIGMTFGAVGFASMEARERLLGLTGGLEAFAQKASFFAQNFLTEAERMAPVIADVKEAMTAIGYTGTTTKDQFKELVLGIDLTTEAGATLYAQLLNLAPAFSAVTEFTTKAAAELAEREKVYADNFLTSQERLAPVQRDVLEQMAAMGLSAFTTKNDFAALVKSLDRTGIVGDSTYRKLMTLAPAFATVADAATAAIEIAQAAATAAIDTAKAGVDTAKANLLTAYHTEKTLLEGVISKFAGFAAAILLLNSGLVSGADAAEGAYRAQVQLARAGNQAAISGLGGSQQAYLAAKLATAGTSIQYQRIVGSVMVTNTMLAATMLTEADAATQQLDALKTQVGLLVDINDSVMSVESAISGLSSAMSSLSSITLSANATLSGVTDAANATLKSVKAGAGIAQTGMSTDETFVTSLYNQLLGRAPDAAGLAGWTAQLAAGASPTSIIAGFTGSQEYMGSHADGLDMVPFDGYVAQLHGGERVKTAAAARQEDAMSSEIRSMRVELNAALVAIALNTGDTAKRIRKFDGEGLPATRT